MKGFSDNWTRTRRMLAVLFVVFSLALVGCSDDTTGPGGDRDIIPTDSDEDAGEEPEEDVEEEGYEAGPLDGQWELSWEDSGEKFSDFDIEHNLDEGRLAVAFDTVDEGDGTLGSANWSDDSFTGQWNPYPLDQGNESFTITSSTFVDEDEARLEGTIAGVTFNIRSFVMERVLD